MKAITREEKIMSSENLTPITRKEMFLAKAAGQNVATPIPITREEMFLSKIGGGGGADDIVVGTWVFNERIELPGTSFNVVFTSNGYNYDLMDDFGGFLYVSNQNGVADNVYLENSGWSKEEYRTIEILEEPTDKDFIDWLKANATKVSGGGGSAFPSQQKTVDITKNGTVEVNPDYGYTLSKVTANVNVSGDLEIFVSTSDVEIFVVDGDGVFTLQEFSIVLGGNGNAAIKIVNTLPEKFIVSDASNYIYVYVVESTGIAYLDFGDGYVTAGKVAFFGRDGYDKGWTTDINSVTEDGVYCVRKSSGVIDVTETPVESSFDNTGDGIPEVYFFSKELPKRFSSDDCIKIDAVKDITDNNGVHQQGGSHYIKYDEVEAGIGTLPPHVYCSDNSSNYLRYSFYVPDDGIYELAAYLRIKDEQLRGATYTINKGTQYEHAFVTTYGWNSLEEALYVRNEIQGAYMTGMLVHLHAGFNTIHITNAAGVTKNQHFRGLYLIKNSNLPKYPYVITMEEAEGMGFNLAKGDILPDYYYISVTFNNGAPRESDGFCRVITSNGYKMSIQKITLDYDQTMPVEGDTVTLRGKVGCVNSTVNGSVGKEARIFDATLVSLSTIR